MTYTQNYQLPQWVKSDRIMMDDFNDTNSKIDAALHGLRTDVDSHAETLTEKGNCQIVFGTYTGTGSYGAASPNTLTFSHKPVFLVVQRQGNPLNDTSRTIMVRDSSYYFPYESNQNNRSAVTWGNTSVSWYSEFGNALQQANAAGVTYCYIAMLQMAE